MNKTIKCLGAKILNRTGIIRRFTSNQKSVRILMYHRVNDNPDCLGLTVSPELFSHQLHYLKDNYEVISLGEAVARLSDNAITTDCCVVTFDDGYRDNYHIAAPLLAEHAVPATIFVTYDAIETGQFGWGFFDRALLTSKSTTLDLSRWQLGEYTLENQTARESTIVTLHRRLKQFPDAVKNEIVAYVVARYGDKISGERTMMTWDEVREMASGPLITIGAHTLTHPLLSRISEVQARHEVGEGKRMLEEKIGRIVDFFAYPNGRREDIGADVVELVKDSGYRAACTTIYGSNKPGANLLELNRIDVTNSTSSDAYNRFSPDLFAFSLSGIFKGS